MKIDFKEIGKGLIGKGLPLVGGILGGGAGESFGATIAGVLGCDPDPASIGEALKDEEKLLALKKYEMDHKTELETIALQKYQAELADVQSARTMHADKVKATGKVDVFLYMLASVLVLGFLALCWIMMNHAIPAEQSQVIYILFGTLASAFGQVIGFFFGSSKSSADKNKMIAMTGKGGEK
jgi:hypothetical protein